MARPYKDFVSGNLQEFRESMLDTLRYRCKLSTTTVTKHFDNENGMNILLKAFTHKSFDSKWNFELLEFRGDRELNLSVVEYIDDKFPHFNLAMRDKTKANLSSKKFLAQLNIKMGYSKFSRYGEEIELLLTSKRYQNNIEACDECMSMYEDNMEGLFGAISSILYKGTDSVGVGHEACHNLMYNLLDQITIPTKHSEVVDAVSRLNEIFNDQGWNKGPSECTFGRCLQKEAAEITPAAINAYKEKMGRLAYPHLKQLNEMAESEKGYISFAYACPKGQKVFLASEYDYTKMGAKQKTAEAAIQALKSRFGIRHKMDDD